MSKTVQAKCDGELIQEEERVFTHLARSSVRGVV